MRRALRFILSVLGLAVALFLLWPGRGLAPQMTALQDLDITEVEATIAADEARFDDLRDGTAKQIIWADAPGTRTDWAVLYLHGFSASRDEIRPVPDDVADALSANLYLTRLTGHGRTGAAMAEARAADWMADTKEALEVAHALGDRVLVIATSTGGTLTALAATDPSFSDPFDAAVLVSPNFSVGLVPDYLLSRPFVRAWAPLVLGETRGFEPDDAETARVWTHTYPVESITPLGTALTAARRRDPVDATMPALFVYSDADQVVQPRATHRWVANWGGGAERMVVEPGEGIDPQTHVITGDIRSPGLTESVVARILAFVETVE